LTLRLQGEGFATAYTSVSVGNVSAEIDNAENAVDEFKKNSKHADALLSHEIIFVLGQADIATKIHTTDFRYMRDLRYPRAESAAAAVNWVFSVPYDLPDLPPPEPWQPDTLRLVLHIRLRRFVYAYREIQEKIVLRLESLLREAKIPARIHVGLGWSDLIIDGTFTRATFENVIDFVMHAHGLRLKIGDGEPLPIVQRILTLLGYSGEPPTFPDSPHVTFLRGVPGTHDGSMVERLKTFGDVFMLDGKFDFLIFTKDPVPEWLANQRVLGSEAYRDRLQKVETHLMFFSADQLKNPSTDLHRIIAIDSELLHKKQCDCRDHHSTWTGILENRIDDLGKKRKLIPQEQLYAIDNMLFLLGATLRDRNICCDAYSAVEACLHGLLTIFDAIEENDAQIVQVSAGPETTAEAIHDALHAHHEELIALIRRLDEWHRFTDLLLRQRTVGSYEEILGQTDRSVVYSGGVQKFLYLADLLIRDFARRLDPSAPPMATIYDSVKTTLSFPSGLVRVPTRNLFTLPVAVIDLWHEAAMMSFLCRHGKQASDLTPKEVPKRELLTNMADHYADIVVYLYGFGGDFDKFVASLAHGFHRIYDSVRYPVRAYALLHTLTRIYLVYELHKLRWARATKDMRLLRLFRKPPELADEFCQELESYFSSHKIPQRYASLDVPASYWKLLIENVTTEDFTNFYRVLYVNFVKTDIETARPNLQAFERGDLVTFSDDVDLNTYFAELAYFIQAPDRAAEMPYFRMMAALGNSAAIEYHRRQITVSD
jgi:hypothetical protein